MFEVAIMKTEPAEEVKQRVNNLIDQITFSVFMYTNRSLFERDKLTFIAQVAFQVRGHTRGHSQNTVLSSRGIGFIKHGLDVSHLLF